MWEGSSQPGPQEPHSTRAYVTISSNGDRGSWHTERALGTLLGSYHRLQAELLIFLLKKKFFFFHENTQKIFFNFTPLKI